MVFNSHLFRKTEENSSEACIIKQNKGALIELKENAGFEIINTNELKLLHGELSYSAAESQGKTLINIENGQLESDNAQFDLSLGKDVHTIKVDQGTVILKPKLWKPRHFWNFDNATDRISDAIGGAHGVLGQGAAPVNSLVGKKAIHFDNSSAAHIHVGSGGGTALGTGSFSVSEGITIEAMITPEWSTEHLDYDEIFRKDYDRAYRLLLSFQNDHPKNERFSHPKNGPGLRLGFGI